MKTKGIVWIKDDFRTENNAALSYASLNHDSVCAIYIYNKEYFDNKREAQKWWISKSLESFEKDLNKFNINLTILVSEEIKFFSKINDKNISFYWNKIYEPAQFELDNKVETILRNKNIKYKLFKGNVLNEYNSRTKNDGTPF